MPVLSRLRLGSIGVDAARFDPLDLELVGPDLRLRHTLLSLRNGGGKSSLIGLVLVLLNPKVASSLGRTSRGDRKLESDYVRRDETGVVLAEWLPDHPGEGPPRRHVTFMAMKRGERDGATDKGFVGATLPMDVDPVEVFELSQLTPLVERTPDRRAHGIEALLRRAREVQRAHPEWEVVPIAGFEPGRWLEHLRSIGLDPGLATLLARMNLEEGDLAKALTFSSADDFVAQAARLLAPADDVPTHLHAAALDWARDHRDQADKRGARDELVRVRPRWAELVERWREHQAAREQLKEEAFDALALLEGVQAAEAAVRARVQETDEALGAARAEAVAAQNAVSCLEGEAAAMVDALARSQLEEASVELERAQAEAESSECEARLSRALLPALRLAETEARVTALQAERAARRTELAPEARRRDALALGLAVLTHADASRATAERDQARDDRARAQDEARTSRQAWAADETTGAKLGAEQEDLERRLAAAKAAVNDLVRRSLAHVDESLDVAVARTARGLSEAEELVARQREALGEAEHLVARTNAEAVALGRAVESLAKQRREKELRLVTATRACEALAGRIAAAQVVGLSEPRLPDDGERVLEGLRQAHRDAVVRQATNVSRLAALEAACESLRARDVLPPPTAVQAVCEAASLTPALEWLRTTQADAAGDALRKLPGLSHGAVAASAAALGRSLERLEALELDVDAPVPVYLAGDLTPEALNRAAGSNVTPRHVVGLAPHASSDARAALLDRRTSERDQVRRLVAEWTGRSAELEGLTQEAAETLAQHGVDAQRTLREGLSALDAELRATAEAKAAARTAADEAAQLASRTRARLETLVAAARAATDADRAVRVACEVHGHVLEHGAARLVALAAERAAVEARSRSAKQAWSDATERADRARERAEAAEKARYYASDETRRFRELVEDRAVEPATIDDRRQAVAELDALQRRLVGGDRALEQAILELRRDAERHRAELRAAAGGHETEQAARAAVTPGLTEADALDRGRRADEQARSAATAVGAAQARRATAKAEAGHARASLEALTGVAAVAAREWSGLQDVAALQRLAAGLPARRDEATARATDASAAVVAAERARDAAQALTRTWSRIVDDAREAWETARMCAPDLEPAIRAVVREGHNAQVILDPAGQAPKLGEAAARHRRELVARKSVVERAENAWLRAAATALADAERSSSEVVRRFASVRVATRSVVDPGSDREREAERVRALALRAQLDLAQLDREVEDLDAQLADVARTRETLANQLAEQVQRLAGRVRDLQRASVLPEGLGAWSGQEFLRIELPVLTDAAELQARLGDLLVQWADRERIPATRDLLPEALAGSLSGPPHVSLPKADRFDRPLRRRPISQIAKDSGGEALTAAFILFCVLARVVSAGSRRGRRISLALIDNPLGTANRFDFVEAQCAVAAAFGVQYVAATGITDPGAIERFERLITLTNLGQERVSVEQHQDRGLGQPIEAVLWARDAVLTASGGVPRRWLAQPT